METALITIVFMPWILQRGRKNSAAQPRSRQLIRAMGTTAVTDRSSLTRSSIRAVLSGRDQDLGSGGVLLLPDLTNAAGQAIQLGTGAGKDGQLYVFNRANMGKFNPQNNNGIYQQLSGALGGPVFSSPAWFNGAVYYG